MDNDVNKDFMALHTHPIVEMLSQMMSIPKITALDMFYNSDFYRLYEREDTKLLIWLWNFG